MKILCYFGHPAQFLFFRETIKNLSQKNHQFILLIKTKDVLEELVQNEGFAYQNILPENRKNSKFSMALGLAKRIYQLFPIIIKNRPSIMISGDPSIQIVGKIFNIPRINVTEDDYEIIKALADIANPLTNVIVCPEVCKVGPYEDKKIGYKGFMKLAYLHPKYFKPNEEIVVKYSIKKPYIIIRLAQLSAFHDVGIKGISTDLVHQIIEIANANNYNIYISSEGNLADEFQKYQLKIKAKDMHHILAFSSLLISDSQSMSVEASMLGVPSLRFSSFAGRISVLEELEHKYQLTFGIPVEKPEMLIEKTEELLSEKNLSEIFKERREKMLSEKINVTDFLGWFIENYPKSKQIMQENPDYQLNFK